MFLPHPRVKVSIVGSLRDREVACSASDRQGSNFESCVWRTVSSQSSHHPQKVLLAQFSLYVHKGGLKPDSFYFFWCSRSSTYRILQVSNRGLSLEIWLVKLKLKVPFITRLSVRAMTISDENSRQKVVSAGSGNQLTDRVGLLSPALVWDLTLDYEVN